MKKKAVPFEQRIGEKHGRLTIIDIVKKENSRERYALCKCDCGNEKLIDLGSILRKGVDSCGCKTKEKMRKSRFIDLTGKKFGRLTVVAMSEYNGEKTKWTCRCDCGKEVIKPSYYLKTSPCPSCGCYAEEKKKEMSFHDITGKRFGKLNVVELDREENGLYYWKCQCDCGNIGVYSNKSLYSRKSCGCTMWKGWTNKDTTPLQTHGMTKHPVFHVWSAMMARCYNTKCKGYKNYGARGIVVCEEWHDVKNFCEWSEKNGYKSGLTIERKDVNGNYCPENCCWATRLEQAINKTTTIFVKIDGEEKPLISVAREKGIDYKKAINRWEMGIRDNERLFYKGDLRRKR